MAKQRLKFGMFNKALDAGVVAWLKCNSRSVLDFYKDLHRHPELSTQEVRTAALVADRLAAAGAQVTACIGGTGVAGVLRNGRGPILLIRADMDALPITEKTGLPYSSAVPGAMHACGHDVHSSVLVAVAAALSEHRDKWRGAAVFVAQPAEELGAGAQMMVDDGLFDKVPAPQAALALHVEAKLPVTQLGYTSGWAAANVDSVDVTIFGKGGHGASPHEAADPIVAAAYFITALQTVVTRRINPLDPSVITVGSIHAGNKHNIIPESVVMQLTVRSYSDDVRKKLLAGIREVALNAARAAGCPKPPLVNADIEFSPSLYHDPALCEHAAGIFRRIVGPANVLPRPSTMGGEDFSVFIRVLDIPGLQYALGSAKASGRAGAAEAQPSVHNNGYYPEALPALRLGVRSMCALAGSLFGRP
jgi:hippurate hydrolase